VSTKGGVGKTSVTASIGAVLADMGQKVLLVDGDFQQSLSSYYTITKKAEFGIIELITKVSPEKCISKTNIHNLHIIQSNDNKAKLLYWLKESTNNVYYLKAALHKIKDVYDFILIDSQGASSIMQESIILASDIQLGDIINIPSLSIMAEINALMNGSKKSLKHEPDALRKKIAQQDSRLTEVDDEQEGVTGLSTKPNDKVDAQNKVSKISSSTAKPKESQPPSSSDENSQLSVITKPDKFPNHLPALRKLIVNQVKKISDLSPGYIGLMIMDEKNPEQKHYIENNIFFDAVNFFDAELHAYPVFGQPVDDTRTMIWWQLQKYSRDYSISDHGQFDKLIQKALESYLKAIPTGPASRPAPHHWLEARLVRTDFCRYQVETGCNSSLNTITCTK
jgi:cellulose biosynthesis protein BcsQ